mgnify:FL=1
MRRSELLRQLSALAREEGLTLVFIREGSRHTLFSIGTTRVVVPRHRDVNDRTARAILRKARRELRDDDL